MQYVAHRALMHTLRPEEGKAYEDLSTERAHLQRAAAAGNARAAQALVPPEYPEWIDYLLTWHDDLYGRSGDSMHGVGGLTWPTVHAWQDESKAGAAPHEVDALFTLDDARRNPKAVPQREVEEMAPRVKGAMLKAMQDARAAKARAGS